MAGGVIYSGVTPTKPPDDRPVTSKLQERRKESSFAHQRDFNAKVSKDARRSDDTVYFKEITESAVPVRQGGATFGSTTSQTRSPRTQSGAAAASTGSPKKQRPAKARASSPPQTSRSYLASKSGPATAASRILTSSYLSDAPTLHKPPTSPRSLRAAAMLASTRAQHEREAIGPGERRNHKLAEVLWDIEEFEVRLEDTLLPKSSRRITPFGVPKLPLAALTGPGKGYGANSMSQTARAPPTCAVHAPAERGARTERAGAPPLMTHRGHMASVHDDDATWQYPKAPLTVKALGPTRWPSPPPVNASRAQPMDQKGSLVAASQPFILSRNVYNCAGDTTWRLKKELLNDKLQIRGPPQPGAALQTSPWVQISPIRPKRVQNFRYEWSDAALTSKEFRSEFFGRGGPDTEVWQQAVQRQPVLSLQPWQGVIGECDGPLPWRYRPFPPGFPGDFRSQLVKTPKGGKRLEKFSLVTGDKHTTTLSGFVPSDERERDAMSGGKYYRNERRPVGWASPRSKKPLPKELPKHTAGWSAGPLAQTSLEAGEHGQFEPVRYRMGVHDFRDTGPEPGEEERKWRDYATRAKLGSDAKGYMRFGKLVTQRFQSEWAWAAHTDTKAKIKMSVSFKSEPSEHVMSPDKE